MLQNGAGFYIYGFGNEMRLTANFENTTIALNTATASGGSGRYMALHMPQTQLLII